MPSIKEQARRLIKNAQQVIAIVMDMFTDVDIFADILNATMRNVVVYIILDKENAQHFINMVSNCRVNLQSIPLLRVRTVSGITYHCRSGKSFSGHMMERFLLTDCRAVLSGNYSFMWSFEKLHRCMAHLFLGQLVSTFDEEFRILFAQSQPLMMNDENVLNPMEDFNPLQQMQFPHEKTSLYRGPRKFCPDDERTDMDWRSMPFLRQESLHSSVDMYNRCPSRHSQRDPSFDQGHYRMPMMENPACGGYDKFWGQDKHSAHEFSETGLTQEMGPPNNFDHVFNYLSSASNVDFDQCSEKLLPASSSSYPRRLSLGHSYACQTSPTLPNPTDLNKLFQEPNADRKNPVVKQGLRNMRICSYLNAVDNPGDEGLMLASPQVPNPFEEPTNSPIQPKVYSVPKVPNFREFKVPTLRRASQLPSYINPGVKKLPDESTTVAAESKTTPSPSESSSVTEDEKTRDKTEEAEPKEPEEPEELKETKVGIQREESFRRKYNAAVPRGSRLRSSLLFSSLDQDTQTAAGQQEKEADKDEAEQTKLPFASKFLVQRRSSAREPFEWSRYIKSASFDNSVPKTSKQDDETSKAEEKNSLSKDEKSKTQPENPEVKPSDEEQANISSSILQSKPSERELSKTVQLSRSLLTSPCVNMNDPDERLMFFREFAAKRKASKAAEAKNSAEKAQMKAPPDLKDITTVKKEELVPNGTSEKMADISVKKQTTSVLPEAPQSESPGDPKLSEPAVNEHSTCQSPTATNETPENLPSLLQVTDKSENTTEKAASESENCPVAEESEVSSSVAPASPTDVKADSTPPIISSLSPESCLPNVSHLDSSDTEPDQKEPYTPTPTSADPPPEQSETSSLVNPDIPPDVPQPETSAFPQDAPTQTDAPSEHNLTGSGSSTPSETGSCSSPVPESVGSVTFPDADAEKTDSPGFSDNEAPTDPSTPSSFSPTEPTSIVTSESDLPSKAESESESSESPMSESPVPADDNTDNQMEVSKEPELPEPFEEQNEDAEATNKVNDSTTKESNDQARGKKCSDEVVPPSPQSKKSKSTQSRYHSSTSKVLSSSNLRDDTKLLLEQISANSQSRNESIKDIPVTDDEKEDKADKTAKRAKDRIRSLIRRPKSTQERKELLEKIQSMRKDRKVYSRFEV
ncbi:hypothetical protein PAMP_001939 [Pampus punctatissimus]